MFSSLVVKKKKNVKHKNTHTNKSKRKKSATKRCAKWFKQKTNRNAQKLCVVQFFEFSCLPVALVSESVMSSNVGPDD